LSDSRTNFVRFLVKRGIGQFDKAVEFLEKATKTGVYQYIRGAGDFFCDIGRPIEALSHYNSALEIEPRDAEAILRSAQCLMLCGDWKLAGKRLQHLAECFCHWRHQKDYDAAVSAVRFDRNACDDVFRCAAYDLQFILTIGKDLNQSVLGIPRTVRSATFEVRNDFDVDFGVAKKGLEEMAATADRFGRKCVWNDGNPIVTRALGFCVLRTAALVKNWSRECAKGKLYSQIIADFAAILSFADYRHDFSSSVCTAAYRIIKQDGTISRFSKVKETIFRYVREKSGVSDVRDLFRRSNDTSFSFESSFCLGDEEKAIPGVNILIENSVALGYDVSVRVNTEAATRQVYQDKLMGRFDTVITEEGNMMLLAEIVLLIWVLHPLEWYNEEIGHVVAHGILLGVFGIEMKERIPHEVFMEQIVRPDLESLQGFLDETKNADVGEECLEFWMNMPCVSTIFHLYRDCFVK
jgi:tetratricopeptide (TPR) repeat protein